MNNGFFHTPTPLYSKPVKISSFTPMVAGFMSKPQNTFFSIQNGNSNNPSTWRNVANRPMAVPSAVSPYDDVYIRHFIQATTPLNCRNLFVSDTAKLTGTILVNGNMQCRDAIAAALTLTLYGTDNFFDIKPNTIPPASFRVWSPDSITPQPIPPFPYLPILSLFGNGPRLLTADILLGSFTATSGNNAWLEADNYSITCTGLYNSVAGALIKRGWGTLTFMGECRMGGLYLSYPINVEFQNGLQYGIIAAGTLASRGIDSPTNGYTNTGTFFFSTNNQFIVAFSINQVHTIDCSIIIDNSITLTNNAGSGNAYFISTGILDGLNSSSTFINKGRFHHQNTQEPMQTGIFDASFATNYFYYNLSGNQNVTAGTYSILEFGGSGVKTLLGNIVVDTTSGGSWSITGTATINYNGFTITTI